MKILINPSSDVILDDKQNYVSPFSPVCTKCKHLNPESALTGIPSCAAFSQIPAVIWSGKNNHTTPFKGDNGIQFEPVKLD